MADASQEQTGQEVLENSTLSQKDAQTLKSNIQENLEVPPEVKKKIGSNDLPAPLAEAPPQVEEPTTPQVKPQPQVEPTPNSVPTPATQSQPKDQNLDELLSNVEQQKKEVEKQRYQELGETLVQGKQLSKDQEDFFKTLSPDARQTLIQQVDQAQNSKVLENLNNEQRQLFQQNQDFKFFQKQSQPILQEGGRQVVHLTDTHMPLERLEGIIKKSVAENNFLHERDVMVHTGDVIEDLIDMNRLGLKAYNPDRIVGEGRLEGEARTEFLEAYDELIEYAGLTKEALVSGSGLEGEAGKQLGNRFLQYVLGLEEPNNLSETELSNFRRVQNLVQHHLKQAIRNHAEDQYKGVREILEEQGLTPENFLVIPGNHDVPEVMRKILGEYMVNPGDVKNVQGLNFGNMLAGSNGEVLGPYMSDEYGIVDAQRSMAIRHNTQSFQKLLETAQENGLNVDERRLDRLFESARIRESTYGLKSNDGLDNYFKNRIEPEIDQTVAREVSDIPRIDMNNVDVLVNHGQLNQPQRAGKEEREVLKYLKETGYKGIVLHGHEHGNTTNRENGVLHSNPGSAAGGGAQTLIYNGSNELEHAMFRSYDKEKGGFDYQFYKPDSFIEQELSKEYRE